MAKRRRLREDLGTGFSRTSRHGRWRCAADGQNALPSSPGTKLGERRHRLHVKVENECIRDGPRHSVDGNDFGRGKRPKDEIMPFQGLDAGFGPASAVCVMEILMARRTSKAVAAVKIVGKGTRKLCPFPCDFNTVSRTSLLMTGNGHLGCIVAVPRRRTSRYSVSPLRRAESGGAAITMVASDPSGLSVVLRYSYRFSKT
ncbi:hypothetical protein QBC39DRAFT_36047 [Podospora conica]|nr:hypothetical protein QBC39DRAFT_36047 [Schizothecium conicum]